MSSQIWLAIMRCLTVSGIPMLPAGIPIASSLLIPGNALPGRSCVCGCQLREPIQGARFAVGDEVVAAVGGFLVEKYVQCEQKEDDGVDGYYCRRATSA
ncbi:hypothetical protein BDV10DRAFT_153661 [Aspergillus recurvatus]